MPTISGFRATSTSLTILILFLLAVPALGQKSVSYHISFPNAAHHEAEISLRLDGTRTGERVEFRMSRTSPGRYALHEFAKNVYNVVVTDGNGDELAVDRPNPHQWDVVSNGGELNFSYTLFADRADGTYSGIDLTHSHLNMPATFAYARQFWEAPIEITFEVTDESWRVATQLVPTDDPYRFTAPNMYYFLDSPTELSDFSERSWPVSRNGKSGEIRLVVHHDGTEQEVDDYAEMAAKIVDEQIAVYDEIPDNEYGTYTFIADYLPHVNGDGMEHRNSTLLVSTRPLSTGAVRNLSTLAHEYFHQWNVERLRPAALEPFDFENANMTGELWFSEGFTSYYTVLMLRRAGIYDDEEFAARLSGTVNAVMNAPGRKYFSAREMSMQAPFVDAARTVDPTNRINTFISYYTFGSGIGLGLDLTLRGESDANLDEYMRALWTKYGRDEIPFTNDDLKSVLGQIAGEERARAIFAQYIEGHEAMDYEALLARAGFVVQPASPDKGWLGASTTTDDGAVIVQSQTIVGSPLYEAGIDRGDTILRWNDTIVTDDEQLDGLLEAASPGDAVEVAFKQRGKLRTAEMTITRNPRVEVVTFESAGRDVSEEVRAFRDAWLSSRVTDEVAE